MYEADRITEREVFIHSQNTNTILKSKGQRRKGGINTPHAVSNCNNGNRKKKKRSRCYAEVCMIRTIGGKKVG